MADKFCMDIIVRWADLDPNGHVRHSVYYDYGAQSRLGYLQFRGMSIKRLSELRIGPVLFREEAKFLKELRFGDSLSIDFQIAGLTESGKRWRIRHNILRNNDEVCAILEMDGAWLDLKQRRTVDPPQELAEIFNDLPKTEDFEILQSRSK